MGNSYADRSYNLLVRRLLRFLWVVLFASFLLTVVAVAYSSTYGYTIWWLRVPRGYVAVNGVRSGYVHKSLGHSSVIITRTDLSPPQSYLVGLSEDRRGLVHCGRWRAPDFFVFLIGDVNPPCTALSNDWYLPEADDPESATLSVRAQSVEFYTKQLKKINASW